MTQYLARQCPRRRYTCECHAAIVEATPLILSIAKNWRRWPLDCPTTLLAGKFLLALPFFAFGALVFLLHLIR